MEYVKKTFLLELLFLEEFEHFQRVIFLYDIKGGVFLVKGQFWVELQSCSSTTYLLMVSLIVMQISKNHDFFCCHQTATHPISHRGSMKTANLSDPLYLCCSSKRLNGQGKGPEEGAQPTGTIKLRSENSCSKSSVCEHRGNELAPSANFSTIARKQQAAHSTGNKSGCVSGETIWIYSPLRINYTRDGRARAGGRAFHIVHNNGGNNVFQSSISFPRE